MTDIAKRFEDHPAQITSWKREFLGREEHAFGPNLRIQSSMILRLSAMICTARWENWRCGVTFEKKH